MHAALGLLALYAFILGLREFGHQVSRLVNWIRDRVA